MKVFFPTVSCSISVRMEHYGSDIKSNVMQHGTSEVCYLTGWMNPKKKLTLHTDGKGHWWNEHDDTVPALEGCRGIDFHFSPFTNTLALRRLGLSRGESADIKVLFISFPEMTPGVARQKYTHLEDDPEGSLYEYESLTSGFITKLPVDQDSLLIEYPRYFKRIWTR